MCVLVRQPYPKWQPIMAGLHFGQTKMNKLFWGMGKTNTLLFFLGRNPIQSVNFIL